MSLTGARFLLFSIWLSLFVFYVIGFLSVSDHNQGIDSTQAAEAAWTVAYILLPVLVAFGVFYLGSQAERNLAATAGKAIRWDQLAVMLGLTIAAHGIMLYFFYIRIWNAHFDFDADQAKSFTGGTSLWFKFLMVLGNAPVVAVNFVLGRADVQLGQPPTPMQPAVAGQPATILQPAVVQPPPKKNP